MLLLPCSLTPVTGRRFVPFVVRSDRKMAGTVPETVLKKRKRDEDWANKKSAAAADAQKKAKASRKDILKRAESYVTEYRNKV